MLLLVNMFWQNVFNENVFVFFFLLDNCPNTASSGFRSVALWNSANFLSSKKKCWRTDGNLIYPFLHSVLSRIKYDRVGHGLIHNHLDLKQTCALACRVKQHVYFNATPLAALSYYLPSNVSTLVFVICPSAFISQNTQCQPL